MNKERLNGVIFFTVMLVVIALWLIKTLNISYPVTITSVTRSGELSVVGEGKVDVVPDIAYINVGITVNNAGSVSDARSGIDSVNNKIIDSLKNLKIPKKDIKTTNYSVSPNYTYDNNENRRENGENFDRKHS